MFDPIEVVHLVQHQCNHRPVRGRHYLGLPLVSFLVRMYTNELRYSPIFSFLAPGFPYVMATAPTTQSLKVRIRQRYVLHRWIIFNEEGILSVLSQEMELLERLVHILR